MRGATGCLRGRWGVFGLALGLSIVAGCDEPGTEGARPQVRAGPLVTPPRAIAVPAPLAAAHCSVNVQGVGVLDLEEDYLPQVIFCENNGANFEALKAQAIAARSVAYYGIETDGSICDGQGCQVFSCGGTADDIHRQAVEATSGMYLMYNSTLTYGFYVAGDSSLTPPACLGNDADAATEHYVTYNAGKSGTSVEQTTLGLVSDPADALYGQNRGCMSQWGSRCLENDAGYDAQDILRFYYGEDIQIVQAQGSCVLDVEEPGGSTGGDDPQTSGPVASDTGASDSSAGSSATQGAASDTAGSGTEGEPEPDSEGDDAQSTGWAGGTEGGAGALPDGYGTTRGAPGCACRQSGSGGSAPFATLIGVVLFAWRRRRGRPAALGHR